MSPVSPEGPLHTLGLPPALVTALCIIVDLEEWLVWQVLLLQTPIA